MLLLKHPKKKTALGCSEGYPEKIAPKKSPQKKSPGKNPPGKKSPRKKSPRKKFPRKKFPREIPLNAVERELVETTQREKKESLVTKPSLLKESLIIPEESLHFIRRSSLIFW